MRIGSFTRRALTYVDGTNFPAGVFSLIFLVSGIPFLVTSFVLRGPTDHSSYVQAQGARTTAEIKTVQNIEHSSTWTDPNDSSIADLATWWTAEVKVQLVNYGADADANTTVHVPRFVEDQPGDVLTVLVDPKTPSYAELPGEPATQSSTPGELLMWALGFGAAGVGLGSLWLLGRIMAARANPIRLS